MKPWEIDPERYSALLAQKCEQARERFKRFSPPLPEVHASPPDSYRVRAEFRVWHDGDALDYVMFDPAAPREPVVISDFPVAVPQIRNALPGLRTALQADPLLRRKLFQVEFLAGDAELLVTLIYHRPLDDAWEEQARAIAARLNLKIIGRSRKQKRVLANDYVVRTQHVGGRAYSYRHYEQSFVQPNSAVNDRMLTWAQEQAGSREGDLLELYCGNANFTLPLAERFEHVLATELSKIGVRAAGENAAANGVENVQIVRLSAEEVSAALQGECVFRRLAHLQPALSEHRFRTVFVDPPRAGLDAATITLVRDFDEILYVSCNPETLEGNLETLHATHQIRALAFFDQFPYTPHLECGVHLVRR